MKYKEQGKYLPSAADWQVACGPNPQWGYEHRTVSFSNGQPLLDNHIPGAVQC